MMDLEEINEVFENKAGVSREVTLYFLRGIEVITHSDSAPEIKSADKLYIGIPQHKLNLVFWCIAKRQKIELILKFANYKGNEVEILSSWIDTVYL